MSKKATNTTVTVNETVQTLEVIELSHIDTEKLVDAKVISKKYFDTLRTINFSFCINPSKFKSIMLLDELNNVKERLEKRVISLENGIEKATAEIYKINRIANSRINATDDVLTLEEVQQIEKLNGTIASNKIAIAECNEKLAKLAEFFETYATSYENACKSLASFTVADRNRYNILRLVCFNSKDVDLRVFFKLAKLCKNLTNYCEYSENFKKDNISKQIYLDICAEIDNVMINPFKVIKADNDQFFKVQTFNFNAEEKAVLVKVFSRLVFASATSNNDTKICIVSETLDKLEKDVALAVMMKLQGQKIAKAFETEEESK